jgi:hypothetical protein
MHSSASASAGIVPERAPLTLRCKSTDPHPESVRLNAPGPSSGDHGGWAEALGVSLINDRQTLKVVAESPMSTDIKNRLLTSILTLILVAQFILTRWPYGTTTLSIPQLLKQ